MSKEIEIEFKNIITKEEMLTLQQAYHIPSTDFVKQTNIYFDTKSFHLKQFGAALRIREKKDSFELTLKQPQKVGLLETTDILTDDDYKSLLNGDDFPNGEVLQQLQSMQVPIHEIVHFGQLTTERAEKRLDQGLLVLDYNYYLNKSDYEVEFEVTDYNEGKQHFEYMMSTHEIPLRPTKNKIVRFYEEKIRQIQE